MASDLRRVTPESLSARLGFPETTIEAGLTHPGIRQTMTPVGGTTSFLIDLDDDRITALEVEIGLGHRGFEKECESRGWAEALPYVSRMALASGVIAEVTYCGAIEALAGIALPDRAIWMRMLVSELARVSDHFARLGAVMTAIGLGDGLRVANRGEALAARALSSATGAGPVAGFVCLGGVLRAPTSDFLDNWAAYNAGLAAEVQQFDRVATSNPTCVRRLRGVAPLGVEDAMAWGVTGPTLRAAGAPIDVRRDQPYLAYGALDFDVPIGERGDDFDRLLVVIEEIRQSLNMIDQCHKLLTSLGPGETRAARKENGGEEFAVPQGESVYSTESSTGELGFFVASDGEGLPRRIRCRAPSFFHAQALPAMLVGARLDDLLPTVALIHLVSAECDR